MLPKSMSEKPKIPLTSRAGIIAKMGAAKHNQQVITKNKIPPNFGVVNYQTTSSRLERPSYV